MPRSQGESEMHELKLRHGSKNCATSLAFHIVEKQAIDDALSGLHGLECTEELDPDNERQIAEKALQSLRVIAPRFENLD
jgi:hypothetical protein